MKLVRILAIVPLTLISLMNVGYPFGMDPKADLVLAIAVVVMGLAGFVAAYGLARNTGWGIRTALVVAGINVVAALIALVADEEGATVGLVVSAVALVLSVAAGSAPRKVAVA